MTPTKACIDLIQESEGLRLKSYKDKKGIWTIGWGNTMYPNGDKVKEGDAISYTKAIELLSWEVQNKSLAVWTLVKRINGLRQCEFDALVDFAYNLGVGRLSGSTLLKKAIINHNDPTIRNEFMRWNKCEDEKTKETVEEPGLTIRCKKRADLYFS